MSVMVDIITIIIIITILFCSFLLCKDYINSSYSNYSNICVFININSNINFINAICISCTSCVLPLKSAHLIPPNANEWDRDSIVHAVFDSHVAVTLESINSAKPLPIVDQPLMKLLKKKQVLTKASKIGGLTFVGGVLFCLTSGKAAFALLSSPADVGIACPTGLTDCETLTSGAVVRRLFGVAGGRFFD